MENKDPTKLITELGRYQEIIGYYMQNPLRTRQNSEQLSEIQNSLSNLSDHMLHLILSGKASQENIGGFWSATQTAHENLTGLLLQN